MEISKRHSLEKIPPNRDPNLISKLFIKEHKEASGHDGTALPYLGGSQTAESGGSRVKGQDPLKDSI